MKDKITAELKDMLKEMIDDEIDLDTIKDLITELGMDSIQIVQLVVMIEEKYEIQIMDEDMDIDRLSKFDFVVDMILRYLDTSNG